jgi:precorrin-2 dehydrogenase/sirohydrochlorin ferrochelatase
MAGYSIELKLTGKIALVVGLGPVGRRKAAALLSSGAHVTAVDPLGGSLDLKALEGLEVVSEPYRATFLRGVSLVIAAGPPEVNAVVVEDASKLGIWVCSTSAPEAGDFTVPAVWKSGPVVLTVSTSGASPALAAILRDQATTALNPAAFGLVAILAELRPHVRERVEDPLIRLQIFNGWADPRWLELYAEQGAEAVKAALLDVIP